MTDFLNLLLQFHSLVSIFYCIENSISHVKKYFIGESKTLTIKEMSFAVVFELIFISNDWLDNKKYIIHC